MTVKNQLIKENMTVTDTELYDSGVSVPLSMSDFKDFVEHRVVNSSEAAELLGCSRQNINDIVKRGKLRPLKSNPNSTLFLKSEIMKIFSAVVSFQPPITWSAYSK